MTDLKIQYTLVAYRQNVLVDHYEEYSELIEYVEQKILPKTHVKGKKIIPDSPLDYCYVRHSNNVIVLAAVDKLFNKKLIFEYITTIHK